MLRPGPYTQNPGNESRESVATLAPLLSTPLASSPDDGISHGA
jgi:hypothetical protein